MYDEIRLKILFLPLTFRQASSVTDGLAKLLIFYSTIMNRPFSKHMVPTSRGWRPMTSQIIESHLG